MSGIWRMSRRLALFAVVLVSCSSWNAAGQPSLLGPPLATAGATYVPAAEITPAEATAQLSTVDPAGAVAAGGAAAGILVTAAMPGGGGPSSLGVTAAPVAPTLPVIEPSAGTTLEVPQATATLAAAAAAAVPLTPLQTELPITTTTIPATTVTTEPPATTSPTEPVNAVPSDPAPTTDPISSTAPVSGPALSRRARRAANMTAAAAVPAAFTAVTCKLDAAGNMAGVVFSRSGASTTGCSTAAVLPGGRNVLLDFSDSQIVQVQQGKLAPTGPVAWLAFRTDSSDMRTCGANVQSSSSAAVVTAWAASGRYALNSITTTCGVSAALTTVASAGFTAALPAVQTLGYGLPATCTPVFTKPSSDVSFSDNLSCKTWLLGNPASLKPGVNQCPYTSKPNQWVQPISRAQLPPVRPPHWVYRTTAAATPVVAVKNVTGSKAQYITATVVHAPIVNVTPAMVAWWFNGNVDGDMQHPVDRQWYPRYLVWHPRDHISQNTLIAGPTKGSAAGAWWSIVEFMMAGNATGYTKASATGSWDVNYIAYNSIKVFDLTPTSLDMRVVVDGQYPFKLLHTWAAAPTAQGEPQLALTSTLQLGLSTAQLLGVENTMNPVAWKLFGGDCAVGAARQWVQHCIEEMGNLQYFLPQLYKQQTGLAV